MWYKGKEEILKQLEEEMKKVVSANLPIERLTVSRLEAMEYFKNIGDTVKSEISSLPTFTDNLFIIIPLFVFLFLFFYLLLQWILKLLKL